MHFSARSTASALPVAFARSRVRLAVGVGMIAALGFGMAHAQTDSGQPESAGETMAKALKHLSEKSKSGAKTAAKLSDKIAIDSSSSGWSAMGVMRRLGLGWAVTAGDLNGDGFDDLVASAKSAAGNRRAGDGAVYVFVGSPEGLKATPEKILHLAIKNSFLGCRLAILGAGTAGAQPGLVVGGLTLDSFEHRPGIAHLYRGGLFASQSSAPDWTAITGLGSQPRNFLSSAVSAAGDVNGDDLPDLLVANGRLTTPDEGNHGVAFLHHGSREKHLSAEPSWLKWGNGASRDEFGFSATGVGDVNGDGFDDVVIGAPGFTAESAQWLGCARLYHGSATGLSAQADWEFKGMRPHGRLGSEVSPAGDINADGFADVWVTAPGSRRQGSAAYGVAGTVFLFAGSADGLSSQPALELKGEAVNARFGAIVRTLGDLDRDGTIEIGVVESHFRDTRATRQPAIPPGRLHLISLEVNKPELPPVHPVRHRILTGDSPVSFAEAVFAPQADFNGDGIPDLAVGITDAATKDHRAAGQVTVVYGFADFHITSEQGVGARVETSVPLWRKTGQSTPGRSGS